MKKLGHLVMGIAIGAALTLSASVAAEEIRSLIGKQIDGEFMVTLNGQQLPVKAGTIEGTSYLPVRVVSEALNLEVGFDKDSGISLKNKEGATMSTGTTQYKKTEYEGIKALEIDGEIFYDMHDYYSKNPDKQFKVPDGKALKIYFPDGKILDITLDDPQQYRSIDGVSYVNVKYFPTK